MVRESLGRTFNTYCVPWKILEGIPDTVTALMRFMHANRVRKTGYHYTNRYRDNFSECAMKEMKQGLERIG